MQTATAGGSAGQERKGRWTRQRRSLAGACSAHALHDGYTDQLYVLLPIWQAEFGLSYAGLAVLRALYYGAMGGLQVPSDRLVAGLSPRTALALATLIAAAGFLVMALPLGLAALCIGLLLAGVGSSLQHPRASLLVASSYGRAARGPLGIYNFAGDLGKVAFPALVAVLLPVLAWREIVGVMAVIGVLVALALMALLPGQTVAASAGDALDAASNAGDGGGRGFNLLMAIGGLDTATRMGYLLFLPFLLQAKGGTEATLGIGLALLFAGGALGKACCGWLGQHLGVTWSVIATETTTALLVVATLMLPLAATLMLLPLLGIVLNGTSSVLYGTVPELARRGEVGKAFAWFYTAVIGVGGLAPIAYGALADRSSIATAVIATALTAIAIIPMVFALRPFLHEGRARSSVGAQ